MWIHSKAEAMYYYLLLFSTYAEDPGDLLTDHYVDIEQRHYRGETTWKDRVILQATYRTGIVGGLFVVPYASRILRHCIQGKESTLNLRSKYIRDESPIVQEYLLALQNKPDGEYSFKGYKQSKDWKLSMAFNPVNITVSTENDQRYATLWYDFDWPSPQEAYDTTIPLGPLSFSLNDGLVHVISDCPSYRVQQTWPMKEIVDGRY
jgi:hypothetical protein